MQDFNTSSEIRTRLYRIPTRTRSVLDSRFPVWSVVWVLRTDSLTMVDCRSVRDSLESNGFVVLPWQTDQCRQVLVRTGSDSVAWFPFWSGARLAPSPRHHAPCLCVISSSSHSASRGRTDQSTRQPISRIPPLVNSMLPRPHPTPNPKNNLRIFCCFLVWLKSRYGVIMRPKPWYIKANRLTIRVQIAIPAWFAKTMLSSER